MVRRVTCGTLPAFELQYEHGLHFEQAHALGGIGQACRGTIRLLTREILAKKRLLYSACDWNFGTRYGGLAQSMEPLPMVCFTDIPMSAAAETICKRIPHSVSPLTRRT